MRVGDMSTHSSCCLVLVALAALATPAHGRQCEYGFKVLDLGGGSCPEGCLSTLSPHQINEAGQVAGVGLVSAAPSVKHAFIWDPVSPRSAKPDRGSTRAG